MGLDLTINGTLTTVVTDETKPLLWVLREDVGLLGAKFGCGVGSCGACTVLIDDQPVRSCVMPTGQAIGKKVQTIEGLNDDTARSLKASWVSHNVPQCGYCQTGQLISAYALLKGKNKPDDEGINAAMNNICRCGTYGRIRAAIHASAAELENAG